VKRDFLIKSLDPLSTLPTRLLEFLFISRRKVATSALVVLIALMGYHAVFGANGLLVYQQKRTEYRKLDAEIRSLQEENLRINDHIKALQTDPKAIEKEAREQLRYAKPGEVIYVAPDRVPDRPQADSRTAKK
jgi:cell division protein FtsB